MTITDEDLNIIYTGLLDNPKQTVGGHAVLSIIDRLHDAEKALRISDDNSQKHADLMDVLLAWEAGEISEGIACKTLGMERVRMRGAKMLCVEAGKKLAAKWREANPPDLSHFAVEPKDAA